MTHEQYFEQQSFEEEYFEQEDDLCIYEKRWYDSTYYEDACFL